MSASLSTIIPEQFPWIRWLSSLYTWLFPRQLINLTGYLHKPGNSGAGVTINLISNEKVLAHYTFWEKEFSAGNFSNEEKEDKTIGTFYELAECAAIWALFELDRLRFIPTTILGTTFWSSYAMYRAGVHAANQGKNETARKFYIEALLRDKKSLGARVNLSMLQESQADMLRSEGKELEAEKLLKEIEIQLEYVVDDLEKNSKDKETIYYSAYYSLALTRFDLGEAKKAQNTAKTLSDEIYRKLIDILKLQKGALENLTWFTGLGQLS